MNLILLVDQFGFRLRRASTAYWFLRVLETPVILKDFKAVRA